MSTHVNICSYALDEPQLREIWDEDLRKSVKRRQVREVIGIVLLSLAIAFMSRWHDPETALALAFFGLLALYSALKHTADESNTNYLIHAWELRDAVARFRQQTEWEAHRPASEATHRPT